MRYLSEMGPSKRFVSGITVLLIGFSVLAMNSFLPHGDLVDVKAVSWSVEGWAVVLEMNNFPEGWTSFPIDFKNSEMLTSALKQLGWRTDHIYVKQDDLTEQNLKDAVDWLVNNTSPGDVALLYIFTHGNWMNRIIHWTDWFPVAWQKVDTSRRLLMVDTCGAGKYISQVRYAPGPHISLAHCGGDELAWAGIPEEGLPIIGSVWDYYLTNGLCNPTADSDSNGFVSVEEAFNFSTPLVQKYMKEKVFTVPAFLQGYHDLGVHPENYDAYPHPEMDDQYPGQFYLDLRYYRLSTDLNGDGRVDIVDVSIVARAFGFKPGGVGWDSRADVNSDGIVNIMDISIVAKDYGKTVQS
jgi:hypothetical protein